jgi:hypothetical protein
MNTNLTFAADGFPQLIRFVLAQCALCRGTIEKGYVRYFRTRLTYCDAQCLAGGAYSVTENRARKVRRVAFLAAE